MRIIDKAKEEGRNVLSEYESKLLLKEYSIPVTKEILIRSKDELRDAIKEIGFPLVIKGCSPEITHKTEEKLVFTNIRGEDEANWVFDQVYEKIKGLKDSAVLVQEMIDGKRELMIGMIRDPQFGPSVIFGLGGIFTEILNDFSFRVAPLTKQEAKEMITEIRANKILSSIRGMPPVNIEMLSEMIVKLGEIGCDIEAIKEMDINPLIISGSMPIVVDALIVLE